jgi:ferredoxin hydrogenase large subunit/hydrogenase large subunit
MVFLMSHSVTLSPVTRIEGHLAIALETEPVGGRSGKSHRVVRARCEGEMFRGFEVLLVGRDPLDAQQIVQRICGVCPISHGLAAIRAQEMAWTVEPSPNGRRLQNLILAANTVQSHVLHFYHLVLPDYVDACRDAVGPLVPRYDGAYLTDRDLNRALLAHYAEAFELRRLTHEMGAVFAGRMPHSPAIVPGGCTQTPTPERIDAYRTRLERVAAFVENVFVPDAVALSRAMPEYWEIGSGCGHMLCFGSSEVYSPGVLLGGKWEPLEVEAIAEHVRHSRYSSPSGLHPSAGQTQADPEKAAAYSWLKAPRYKGLPMEVGPLARMLVNYHGPEAWPGRPELDRLLAAVNIGPERLVSVWGRIVCRALEAKLIVRQAARWLADLEPNGPPARDFKCGKNASGHGLLEAPRGALGHWLTIEDGKIKHYQCVVPTTWNCSPCDDVGQPGPLEKALEGLALPDPEQPLEAGRVIRSFDPCLACAVH